MATYSLVTQAQTRATAEVRYKENFVHNIASPSNWDLHNVPHFGSLMELVSFEVHIFGLADIGIGLSRYRCYKISLRPIV